jgi:imidazolonepropionase-like amidohydrolase
MPPILFTNVSIFAGEGDAFPGEVLVQGNRIKTVARGTGAIDRAGAELVDGGGATLMPGLVEAHAHLSFPHCATLEEMGRVPPEEHTLITAYNAKRLLDAGFTSAYSASAAKLRLDVVIRNEINAGRLPGPRLRAASPEITATGGFGDVRQLHLDHHSTELVADGPLELRKLVRLLAREGVENVKVNLSGDNASGRMGFSGAVGYTDEEAAAVADQAREWGLDLCCHAQAARAVQMALRHGFRVIYHCSYADDETLDQVEAKKDEIFVAPAVGIVYATAYDAGPWGITREKAEARGAFASLERYCTVYQKMRKRGIRVLPGGDYGFAWTPIGTNARDFELFQKLFGYTPREILTAATKHGGALMLRGDGLGQVREGFLADLILVDGDPLQDVTLFQNHDRILMIMKDGAYHKPPQPRGGATERRAA